MVPEGIPESLRFPAITAGIPICSGFLGRQIRYDKAAKEAENSQALNRLLPPFVAQHFNFRGRCKDGPVQRSSGDD